MPTLASIKYTVFIPYIVYKKPKSVVQCGQQIKQKWFLLSGITAMWC